MFSVNNEEKRRVNANEGDCPKAEYQNKFITDVARITLRISITVWITALLICGPYFLRDQILTKSHSFLILGYSSFAADDCLSQEPTDMSRCWISSLVMLCQAMIAVVFTSCLFLECFAFSFFFREWKTAQLGSGQVTDLTTGEHSTSLP